MFQARGRALQRTGALITSLALLVDATIIRVLLVPATMRLLGRASWLAPRPLRRLYARYGLRKRLRPNGPGFPSEHVLRARAAEEQHSGLPGLFLPGTVASAARPGAAVSPPEE